MFDFDTRITHLEREARAWRLVALAAVAGLGVALAPQVTAQDAKEGTTVKAPFTVTDEKGEQVFVVTRSAKSGNSDAVLIGPHDGVSVILATTNRSAGVSVAARSGDLSGKGVSARLEANRNTGPEFRMNDEEGKTIVRLPSR